MPEMHHRSGSRTFVAALLSLVAALTAVLTAAGGPGRGRGDQGGARDLSRVRSSRWPATSAQTTCSPRAKPGVANFASRLLTAYPSTRSLGIVRAARSAGARSTRRAAPSTGASTPRPRRRPGQGREVPDLAAEDGQVRQRVRDGPPARHPVRDLEPQDLGLVQRRPRLAEVHRRQPAHRPRAHLVHLGRRAQPRRRSGPARSATSAPRPPRPCRRPPRPRHRRPAHRARPVPPRPQPLPAAALPAGPALQRRDRHPARRQRGRRSPPARSPPARPTWSRCPAPTATAAAPPRSPTPSARAPPVTAPGGADRSVHPWQPSADHLDLYVDGVDLEGDPDDDAGDCCDTATHTYRWTYVPTRTGRVAFAVWDPTTLADNSGALRIRVVALTPRDEMTLVGCRRTPPPASPARVRSRRADSYLPTVTGDRRRGRRRRRRRRVLGSPRATPSWRRDRSVLGRGPVRGPPRRAARPRRRDLHARRRPGRRRLRHDPHTYRLTLRPQ